MLKTLVVTSMLFAGTTWAAQPDLGPRADDDSRQARLVPSPDPTDQAHSFLLGRKMAVATDIPAAFLLGGATFGLVATCCSPAPAVSTEIAIAGGVFVLSTGLSLLEDFWIDRNWRTSSFDFFGYVPGVLVGGVLWVSHLGHVSLFDPVPVLLVLNGFSLGLRLVMGLIPDRQGITNFGWAILGSLLGIDLVATLVSELAGGGSGVVLVGALAGAGILLVGRIVSAVAHARNPLDEEAAPLEVIDRQADPTAKWSGWAGPLEKGRASSIPVAAGVALRF